MAIYRNSDTFEATAEIDPEQLLDQTLTEAIEDEVIEAFGPDATVVEITGVFGGRMISALVEVEVS